MMLASCCENRGLLSFRNAFGAASFIGFKAVCAGDAPFALGGNGCGLSSTLVPPVPVEFATCGGNGWGFSSTLLPGVAAFFWASAQTRALSSHIVASKPGLKCACCRACMPSREKSNCLLED